MKVNELRIQHLEKPIGIGTRQPLLSYRLSAEEPDQAQSAYQILAATKKGFWRRKTGQPDGSGREVSDLRKSPMPLCSGKRFRRRAGSFRKEPEFICAASDCSGCW